MSAVQSIYPRWLRQRVELTARLALDGGAPEPVEVVDLSLRGAFAVTARRAPAGSPAALVLELPEGPLTLDALVTRSGATLRRASHPELERLVIRATGVGLRFISVRGEARRRLQAHLSAVREV